MCDWSGFSEESGVASTDRRSKVIEADRAGSCSIPPSSQPRTTPPAAAPASSQLTCSPFTQCLWTC